MMNENNDKAYVSYFVHEGEMMRQERHAKRWAAFAVILFLALLATNAGWIVHALS